MPSFQTGITPSRRAAARFISAVRRSLQKALAEEENKPDGITQSAIARAIGVNRSVIHREIRGHADIALGRAAEIAWALGYKPQFSLVRRPADSGSNHPPAVAGARAAQDVQMYAIDTAHDVAIVSSSGVAALVEVKTKPQIGVPA